MSLFFLVSLILSFSCPYIISFHDSFFPFFTEFMPSPMLIPGLLILSSHPFPQWNVPLASNEHLKTNPEGYSPSWDILLPAVSPIYQWEHFNFCSNILAQNYNLCQLNAFLHACISALSEHLLCTYCLSGFRQTAVNQAHLAPGCIELTILSEEICVKYKKHLNWLWWIALSEKYTACQEHVFFKC